MLKKFFVSIFCFLFTFSVSAGEKKEIFDVNFTSDNLDYINVVYDTSFNDDFIIKSYVLDIVAHNINYISNDGFNVYYDFLDNKKVVKADIIKYVGNSKLYRCANEAILNLYKRNYISSTSLKDSKLDFMLKKSGYKGIKDIDIYYVNYYNNKYKTFNISLSDFNDNQLRDIFSGVCFDVVESNSNVKRVAREYFERNIFNKTNVYNSGNKYQYKLVINNDYLPPAFNNFDLLFDYYIILGSKK